MTDKVKYFVLKAEAGFFATDIDDALMSLAYHFKNLAQGRPTNLFATGEIKLTAHEETQQRTDEAPSQELGARGRSQGSP